MRIFKKWAAGWVATGGEAVLGCNAAGSWANSGAAILVRGAPDHSSGCLLFRPHPRRLFLRRVARLFALQPCAQNFRDAPCLRDAAARQVRSFSIKNFADRSNASFSQVRNEALQLRQHRRALAFVDL